METIVDQLESKAQTEHTLSPKRERLSRQSHRWPACLHQADEDTFSPSL